MKKKLLCWILVTALAIMSLAGCKKDGKDDDAGKPTQEVTKDPQDGGSGIGIDPDAGKTTPEPTLAPTAIPEPTEVPKPEGMTFADGTKSPVAGNKGDFMADEFKAQGFTVVTSAKEFIDAVKPGAKIIFAPGIYNLTDYTQDLWSSNETEENRHEGVMNLTEWVDLTQCFDGPEITIRNVDDLVICGGSQERTQTELVIEPRYAAVFRFEKCNDLTMINLTVGHTDTGDCTGNVIDMNRCTGVKLYNMDIYGCGVYGLGIDKGSGDIHVYNSKIHDCSYGAFDFEQGMGALEFIECELVDSAGLHYTESAYSSLRFEKCTLGDWETTSLMFKDNVEVIDCKEGNMVGEYPDYEEYPDDAPYWYGQPFDPSSFDFDSMEEAYDDEYLAAKPASDSTSYWKGYMKVQSATGRTTYLPAYDVAADTPVNAYAGFRLQDDDYVEGTPTCWLSIDDVYYTGSWYYDSAYSAVITLDETEENTRYGGQYAYVSVYRDMDTEGSHPWLMLQLGNDVFWLY